MTTIPKHIVLLYDSYLRGDITAEEQSTLDAFMRSADTTTIAELVGSRIAKDLPEPVSNENNRLKNNYAAILKRIEIPAKPRSLHLVTIASAAAAVLVLALCVWLIAPREKKTALLPNNALATSSLPGGHHGTITKSNNGQRIIVPRGSYYDLKLSDGSSVRLNAGSSLEFPESFTGTLRRVRLTGEAYFRVAKDRRRPFIVLTAQQEITVLGTHFNVRSYAGETSTLTTLAEGSVSVADRQGHTARLLPGQQAASVRGTLQVQKVEVPAAIAWTEKRLSFVDLPIGDILAQAGRWFSIDIRFDGALPTERFTGELRAGATLNAFAGILKANGFGYTIQGRKMTVFISN